MPYTFGNGYSGGYMSHALRAAVYGDDSDFDSDFDLSDVRNADIFDGEDPTLPEAPLFLGEYDRIVPAHMHNWAYGGHDTLVFLTPADALPGQAIPAYDLGGEG